MTWPSDHAALEKYSDLLDNEDGLDTARIVRALDAGYNLHRPPPSIRSMPALRPRREVWEKIDGLGQAGPAKRPWGLHTKFYAALSAVTVLVLLTAASVTTAGTGSSGVSYLGVMTSALPRGNPAGEFKRIPTNLRVGTKPEVLFIGTTVDADSTAERWPLVKALDQFGTWTGLAATMQRYCSEGSTGSSSNVPDEPGIQCVESFARGYLTPPTFDFSHARYSSKHIAFVNRDLIDSKFVVHSLSSPIESMLVSQHALQHRKARWTDDVWDSVLLQGEGPTNFPILVIGNELSTGSNIAIVGDLTPMNGVSAATFVQVLEALQRDIHNRSRTSGPNPALNQDYNAEANVITAFICHADGSRPATVCGRNAIKIVLRRIR